MSPLAVQTLNCVQVTVLATRFLRPHKKLSSICSKKLWVCQFAIRLVAVGPSFVLAALCGQQNVLVVTLTFHNMSKLSMLQFQAVWQWDICSSCPLNSSYLAHNIPALHALCMCSFHHPAKMTEAHCVHSFWFSHVISANTALPSCLHMLLRLRPRSLKLLL